MEKLLNGNLTVFVYDTLGQLAAEYDSGNTPTPVCQTCYLVQDLVRSTRLVTDDVGRVAARHDFLPFGEEIAGGTGGRSNDWGITDYVDQKFTSQVRDAETGLDYFNARYYGSALGRFLSADPANAGARMGDPQSWNGYGYVRGSPLDLVDPSGMCTSSDGSVCFEGSSKPACRWWQVWCWAGSNEGGGTPEDVDEWVERFISGSETILTGGGSGGGGQPGGGQQQQQQRQAPPSKSETPDNVCANAGFAFDPSVYAAAGREAKWNPFRAISDLVNGFKIGGYLDPQPLATGDIYQRAAYGNYSYGVWMSGSGTPLPIALTGAAGIAALHKISNPGQYADRTMDPIFGSLPAANVINIIRGYSDQKNGTLCHK